MQVCRYLNKNCCLDDTEFQILSKLAVFSDVLVYYLVHMFSLDFHLLRASDWKQKTPTCILKFQIKLVWNVPPVPLFLVFV